MQIRWLSFLKLKVMVHCDCSTCSSAICFRFWWSVWMVALRACSEWRSPYRKRSPTTSICSQRTFKRSSKTSLQTSKNISYFVVLDYCNVFRPHRSTMSIDAAYCYLPSSVVCLSVCLSVCHTSEPCKDGCTDRDAVWVQDSGGPKEPYIRWGSRFPMGRGNF